MERDKGKEIDALAGGPYREERAPDPAVTVPVVDALGRSPEFQRLLSDRLASRRPLVNRGQPTKKRRHVLHVMVDGRAQSPGQVQTESVRNYQLFKPDRIVATDDSKRCGYGTRVTWFTGNRIQLGSGFDGGLCTAALAAESTTDLVGALHLARIGGRHELADLIEREFLRGAGVGQIDLHDIISASNPRVGPFDTVQPGLDLAFQVQFDEPCHWDATIWGWVLD